MATLFETVTASSQPSSHRAFVTSILLHVVVVAGLIALSLSGILRPSHRLLMNVTQLVAPMEKPPVSMPVQPAKSPRLHKLVQAAPFLPETRLSRAFVAPVAPPPARPVTEKVSILPDIAPPAIVAVTRNAVEVPQLTPTIAAPAPKLGNLTDARIDAPPGPKTTPVRAAGFGAPASPATAPGSRAQVLALGEFASARTSGSSGNTAQIRSSGFASEKSSATATSSGTVSRSGFTDVKAAKPDMVTDPVATSKALDNAVEILSKPKPEYSAEARQLRIEGEVLLEVLFQASGKAHSMRVVRGLGHGLDEAAQTAVERIAFRPAHRNNIAVDATAVVHIVFQLAY